MQNARMSEQTDDQPPEDEDKAGDEEEQAGEDAAGEGGKGRGGDTPEDERLAEVAEHIDKARTRAEDAGVLVEEEEEEDEEEYADSGADPSEDDQTIAPPG